MKRRIAGVLLLILMLLVVGCGENGGAAQTSSTTPSPSFLSRGSSTSVRVPNVLGMSQDEAESQLNAVGLQVSSDIRYQVSDKEKGTVLLCSPLPGSSVPSGSSVQLTLSSGEKEKKSITIEVDLPADIPAAKLEVYVDGTLDSSKSTTVDTSFKSTMSFTFTGTQGKRDVRIKLNDQLYQCYEIDFDNNSYKVTDP